MKLFRTIHICIFFVFILQSLVGQQNESNRYISEINFNGINKTKKRYLDVIVETGLNKSLNLKTLEKDLQNLKNLPGIASAEYSIDTLGDEFKVDFLVTERRTALPIVNFGGIRGNIWFSLGIAENNYRGLGETLTTFYQNNNGRHSGQLFFVKPRILNSNLGYSITLNKWSSEEPVFFETATVQYNYDNNGVSTSLIRNFGLRNLVEIGANYFVESYEKLGNIDSGNLPGPENFSLKKFLTKVLFKHQNINYHFFYLEGKEILLNFQNVMNFGENIGFNSLQIQLKHFSRPRPKLNLATRIKWGISTNNDTPFAPFVADSHVNIRGIGNRIDRGTAQVILNFELRYTIYDKKFWSSQLVLFSDSGTWRNPGGELKDIFNPDQFRQFVGLGFRVNNQKIYGATLRVDYGIDIYDTAQRGIVIGLGQYF